MWIPGLVKYNEKYDIYFPAGGSNYLINLHVYLLRLKNMNNSFDMNFSLDGTERIKIENSFDSAAYQYNVLSGV